MRKVIVIIALLIASSCRVTRRQSVNTTLIKHDTIIRESVIRQEFHDTSFIDNPCDSLGILKAFNQTVKTDGVVVKVFSDSGRIKTIVKKQADTSSFQKYVTTDTVTTIKVDYKETVKYRTPKWAFILLILNILGACIWFGMRWVKSRISV